MDACIAEAVPVLSFFWGDPTPYMEKAHKARFKVCAQEGLPGIQSVRPMRESISSSPREWKQAGAIAGAVTTMVLTPQAVETVAPIPVVTAGGGSVPNGLVRVQCDFQDKGAPYEYAGDRHVVTVGPDFDGT